MIASAAPIAGEPIPSVLTLAQLAEQIGLGIRQVNRHRQQHDHPAIKQLDAPGHPKFCGLTVKRWRDGQHDERSHRLLSRPRKYAGEGVRERSSR